MIIIKLNPGIKKALTDIHFIQKYEQLSNTFNDKRTPLDERLRYYDGKIIIESLARLGYKVSFEASEKYFKTLEERNHNYTFCANIVLESGMVDLVWIVKENGKLILGLPIGEYSRLMVNPNYKIKKPIFGTYEDLDEILRICFELFEELKQALILLR